MKRGLTVAVAGAAILAAGLSGCSSNKNSSSGSPSAATSSGGASGTKVIIDGQDQHITGTAVCTTVAGNVNIAIGGQAAGIAAVLTDANPPEVKSVALGNVNGMALGYTSGTGEGKAEASRTGNTYKITGTATGIDPANPMTPTKKPFELDVTCS